tara:strand:- start:363 stop:554 length:192 start_codon:yes stop_codon:yes gene_type:complete
MEYVPVMLSTPLVDVMLVRVPEAVVLREELHAAVVVVELAVEESSSLAQDPRINKIVPINTIQ